MRVLLWLLLTLPVLAQSPSDGARVLSTGGNVTLSWPGSAKAEYLLQVSLAGQEIFAGMVRGNRARLDEIRPGLYRWQVSPRQGAGWLASSQFYSFQLATDERLSFDGHDAAPSSRPSVPGRPGQNAPTLRITLTPGDPYLQLTINHASYLLSPDSGPLTISARGGRGGDGGPETPPGPVPLDAGGTVIWMPGGAARPPGRGGPGGAGGRVTVSGPQAQRYLTFQLEGGAGGEPAGIPGPPGHVEYR